MLKHLSIKNFALIDSLEIDFVSGFSVITGETGTGKSVFLGAVSMLLGQRSDTKAVREGTDRCVIEGYFDLSAFALQEFFEANDLEYDATECIIRRELSATGRSRAFVNDSPVSVSLLKELGAKLIDIHSQHQNLLLADKNFQIDILDRLSNNSDELAKYKNSYKKYCEAAKKLEQLKATLAQSKDDEEWLRYQLEQIDNESFSHGEQEELEQEQSELAHAEEIQGSLYAALNIIEGDDNYNMVQSLREAANTIARIAEHYPMAQELSERIESVGIELKDCSDELRANADKVVFAPDRLEWVDARLTRIYDMERKHKVTSLNELLTLAEDYRARLSQIDNGDEEIKSQEKLCNALHKDMEQLASVVTEKRKAAAMQLQQEITAILVTLGMPLVRFNVEFSELPKHTNTGIDAVTFLFSANSISPLQPLSDVASGGEMSRVMLALKSLIAGNTKQPTLIFDEIDTGISGILAERMGLLMKKMGESDRQVLSITHLPQVAALGSTHYKVYKEETPAGTRTNIIRIDGDERVREIAQMSSGEQLTDAAIANARLLLGKQ